MASVERIDRDIAELDQAVAMLAKEFYTLYADYLKALGQSVRQQIILASFHLCTQGYPQQFLAIALHQRQALQRSLRELAKDAQANLQAILYEPGTEEQVSLELEQKSLADGNTDESLTSAPVAEKMGPPPVALSHPTPFLAVEPPASATPPRSLTPMQLITWQENVELSILKELQLASHQANRLLQQAGILPAQIAETLLQNAGRPEIAEMAGSVPNLLNLLIATTEGEDDSDADSREDGPPTVMQILAIQLRLPEIEFAEAPLTVMRNQLRSLSVRLKKLGQAYQKKMQERAIAQAQDAWRASWYED